jgi:hypothetical protein
MSQPIEPTSPWTVAHPEETPDEVLEAEFRKIVDDAVAWATTEGKRDQLMNALHDVLVGLGPDETAGVITDDRAAPTVVTATRRWLATGNASGTGSEFGGTQVGIRPTPNPAP